MGFFTRSLSSIAILALLKPSFISGAPTPDYNSCRCIPGDPCWPKTSEWDGLNKTVDGRLIANVPLATPCHDPHYDAAQCQVLKQGWASAIVHEDSSTSLMSAWFQNGSCDPFQPQSQSCALGNYPIYSVNLNSADDAIAGVKFAQKNNIRFVVKNTGHDFLGKSAGAHSLSLWTHNMNSVNIIPQYKNSFYSGPAAKLGAGVRGAESLPAMKAAGLRIVSGSCPSVGIVGGFTQGGGHSSLTSTHGLGADQVLEWEVVTADGRHVTATPTQNQELYWALSGGGPGTYGVVISMTVRAYPDTHIGGAAISFAPAGNVSKDAYWKGVAAWQANVPAMVDAGAAAGFLISSDLFLVQPVTYPNASADQVRKVLQPFTSVLDKLSIPYSLNVTDFDNFYDHYVHYLGPLPAGLYPVDRLMGGRLIPRDVVTSNNQGLIDTYRDIAENQPDSYLGFVAVGGGAGKPVADNAVLPQWRTSVISVLAQTQWDYGKPFGANKERERELNEVIVPKLTALTPGAGTYLNEANFANPNWKADYYGRNYDRLRDVKRKWDPKDLFFGPTMVGSDAWKESAGGRLCRA